MDLLSTCLKSSEFLETILSSVQHPILLADEGGRILNASPLCEEVFGVPAQDLVSQELSALFTEEDLDVLYPNLLDLARRGERFDGEIMLQGRDRNRFFAFLSMRACGSPLHGERMIILSIRDIDTQKRLEQERRGNHYDDLIKVADGIAHELRNPIVGIGGFVNRLYDACKTVEGGKKYYNYIITNLKKIEALVKKVEFFAHLPRPSFVETDLRELAESALSPYEGELRSHGIRVENRMTETHLRVDPELFIKVFSVFTENALDAMPHGGSIRLDTALRGDTYRIVFEDTGHGIPSQDLPYIFNPFFSTKADGAGIDLAVVKRIVETHGGTIQVSSQLGQGTRFEIHLPTERRRAIRVTRI
ncbi:MAG: PAS domain S-box protein [Deltaproteobacteria bacterium]|nr:PAS domain S-box protein [Deltaproteobacteria bacterium]